MAKCKVQTKKYGAPPKLSEFAHGIMDTSHSVDVCVVCMCVI